MGGGQSQQEKDTKARSTADQATTDKLAGTSSDTLSQYMGDVTQTPYYQSLLKSGTTSTNQAYDNSSRNLKQSMEGAGVSSRSPAAVGNTAAVGAQRASALGTVGTNAMQQATQTQLQATGLENDLAKMYSGEGTQYSDQSTELEKQRQQNQAGLWGAMLGAGAGLGSAAMKTWG